MRLIGRHFLILLFVSIVVAAQQPSTQATQQPSTPSAQPTYTLTVYVDGVNKDGGNIGILVFNNDKGWAEDRFAALKDIVVDAHPGTVVVKIPGLPAGNYALAVAHDVNRNHKVDKNWIGKPTEQWGMSNNPHATIKAPPFKKAMFNLSHDADVHIEMQ